MSSAICLIYLATEYSCSSLPVSAFRQPRRQPASKVIKQASTFNRQLLSPFSCISTSHICLLFRKRWRLFLELAIASCCNLCGVHEEQWLLLVLMFSAGALWRRGRGKEEGESLQLLRGAHLLSLTPPGTRSNLCGDLAPLFTLTHSLPFYFEEAAPNSLCITRDFEEAPVAAWFRLDCRDCCLAELWCGGQVVLAWQQILQWLSH